MSISPETCHVTLKKAEYDDLRKAANALMLIFNTDPLYLEQTVNAAKKAIFGPDSVAEPTRAEISE